MNSIGRASEYAIGNNTSPNEEIRTGGAGGGGGEQYIFFNIKIVC